MELDARRMNTARHFGVVPYSCAGHLVPYVAAVNNPYTVTSLKCHCYGNTIAGMLFMYRGLYKYIDGILCIHVHSL